MIETIEPTTDRLADLTPGVRAAVERGALATAAEQAQRTRMRAMRFDTIAVHGVYGMAAALANQGSIIEPAYLSPAQHFVDSDAMEAALAYLAPAWGYSRIANPTFHYLEETLALLETYGTGLTASTCVTGSGMAAIHLATNAFLSVGPDAPDGRPNVVVSAKCYGGTFMLFNRYAAERGVDVRWVTDPLDLDAWASRIDGETRFVFGEMPSNPALAIFDIEPSPDWRTRPGCRSSSTRPSPPLPSSGHWRWAPMWSSTRCRRGSPGPGWPSVERSSPATRSRAGSDRTTCAPTSRAT